MVKSTTKVQRKLVKRVSRLQERGDHAGSGSNEHPQEAASSSSSSSPYVGGQGSHTATPASRLTRVEAAVQRKAAAVSASSSSSTTTTSNNKTVAVSATGSATERALKRKLRAAKKSGGGSSKTDVPGAVSASVALGQHEKGDRGDSDGAEGGRRVRRSALRPASSAGSGMNSAKAASGASVKQTSRHQRRTTKSSGVIVNPRGGLHLHLTPAEQRMATAQQELALYERVIDHVPAFAADPFAAVMEHLNSTMDMLQPQTPDVGRAPVTHTP